MPVKQVSTLTELKQIASTPRLTCVDCFATWCGPCKAIAPVIDELSRKYAAVNFVKIDVDEAQELAQSLSVRAMPTFIFFKQGKEVDRMEGADPSTLEKKIKEHGANVVFEGQGHRLGDVATSNTNNTATASATATNNTSEDKSVDDSQQTTSREWPLEVPAGHATGKVLLQIADGTRNPLKIAPELHTVSDLYRGVAQMLDRQVSSFVLSSREGMKTVELKSDDRRTLKEARVAGGVVLLKSLA